MALDLVLNELSLYSPAPDTLIARRWVSDFIQTVRAIKAQAGKQAILRTQYDFYTTLLAPDYPLQRWLNDGEVDREEQRFIKALVTKAPFSQDVLNAEVQAIETNVGSCEFQYQGEQAIGLGVDCILDIIPVSLTSQPCWDCSYLDLDVIRIDEDDEKITIVHASRKEHLKDHIEWIKTRLLTGIRDGVALWNSKDEFFPNLQFCDSVGEQLQNLRVGNIMLSPIEKKLFDLQEYAATWVTGAFDSDKMAYQSYT